MSRNGKARLALVILAAALILSLGLAVSVGSMAIPMGDVYQVMAYELFGLGDGSQWGSGGVHDVVWLIRLPRLVLAAATGAGLGLCGAVMQAMVQNTMADPYILGVSSGAYLGAALALTAGAGTALGGNAMGLFGAVGAFLAAAAVLLLSRLGGRSTPIKLLLSGVALSAVCSALGNFCIVLENNDHAAAALVQWTMGGMGAAKWPGNAIACGVVVSGGLFFWSQYRTLNLMLLGDDCAGTLGVELAGRRLMYLLVVAAMVGVLVYQAGMVGFVGLIIPHGVRLLFGSDHRTLLPLAGLTGAVFLVWMDVLCRVVLPGSRLRHRPSGTAGGGDGCAGKPLHGHPRRRRAPAGHFGPCLGPADPCPHSGRAHQPPGCAVPAPAHGACKGSKLYRCCRPPRPEFSRYVLPAALSAGRG